MGGIPATQYISLLATGTGAMNCVLDVSGVQFIVEYHGRESDRLIDISSRPVTLWRKRLLIYSNQ